MTTRGKVAVIGTGGTISSVGRNPMDLQNYVTLGKMLDAEGMIEKFPEGAAFADLIPVAFPPIPSTKMTFSAWARLVEIIDRLVAEHDDLRGIVILHGTAEPGGDRLCAGSDRQGRHPRRTDWRATPVDGSVD